MATGGSLTLRLRARPHARLLCSLLKSTHEHAPLCSGGVSRVHSARHLVEELAPARRVGGGKRRPLSGVMRPFRELALRSLRRTSYTMNIG